MEAFGEVYLSVSAIGKFENQQFWKWEISSQLSCLPMGEGSPTAPNTPLSQAPATLFQEFLEE